MVWFPATKWLIYNWGYKDPLFSATLKVEESKLPLCFWLDAFIFNYSNLSFCTMVWFPATKWPYLLLIDKIKIFCFLKLWKLEKANYTYFLDWMLYSFAINTLFIQPCPSVQWFDYISFAKRLIKEIKAVCFLQLSKM